METGRNRVKVPKIQTPKIDKNIISDNLGTSGTGGPNVYRNRNITDMNLQSNSDYIPIPKKNNEKPMIHVSLEQFAAFIGILVVVGSVVWFFSKLDSKVDSVSNQVVELKSSSEAIGKQVNNLTYKVSDVEKSLEKKANKK